MTGSQQERERLMPLAEAREVVELQFRGIPALFNEWNNLSAGKPGVLKAILARVSDEVSYNPLVKMTPDVMREMLGVPGDSSKLEEWRFQFYQDFMATRKPLRP